MSEDSLIGVDPDEKTKLVTAGIYSTIRNPICTGSIIYGFRPFVMDRKGWLFANSVAGANTSADL